MNVLLAASLLSQFVRGNIFRTFALREPVACARLLTSCWFRSKPVRLLVYKFYLTLRSGAPTAVCIVARALHPMVSAVHLNKHVWSSVMGAPEHN
jgi:hypothetical protein